MRFCVETSCVVKPALSQVNSTGPPPHTCVQICRGPYHIVVKTISRFRSDAVVNAPPEWNLVFRVRCRRCTSIEPPPCRCCYVILFIRSSKFPVIQLQVRDPRSVFMSKLTTSYIATVAPASLMPIVCNDIRSILRHYGAKSRQSSRGFYVSSFERERIYPFKELDAMWRLIGYE